MNTSTNYKFNLPVGEDFYNVEDFTENFETIDTEMKKISNMSNSALPKSDYTANDILAKLKTVDGSGSGLDADLFKGKTIIPIENGGTGKSTIQEVNNAFEWSNPNLLINGDFQVWQRGDSFNAAGYTADRWKNVQVNTAVTKIKHLQEGLCSKFAIKLTKTKDNGGNIYLHQALEDYKTILKGKTLTVSFWAIGVGGFSGYFGVQIGNTNGTGFNLTNKWTKYQYTVKGVDTSEETDIRRRGVFFYSLASNQPQTGQGLAIAEVKLEYGEIATPFVPRTYQEELALCQRYYYNPIYLAKGYPYLAVLTTRTNGGTFWIQFPVPMRIIPTLLGDFNNLYIKDDSGKATAITGITIGDGTNVSIMGLVTSSETFTANQVFYLQYRSTSPNYTSFSFDAEIY